MNTYRRFASLFFAALCCTLVVTASVAQSVPSSQDKGYEILASDSHGFTIVIHPKYEKSTVYSGDSSQKFVKIHALSGSTEGLQIGAPAVEKLRFPFVIPSSKPATFHIVSEKILVEPNVDLSPVPYIWSGKEQVYQRYSRDENLYSASNDFEKAVITTNGIFRTAFTNTLTVSPIQYDAETKILRRSTEIIIRVTFSDVVSSAGLSPISTQESQFFQSLFVNGERADLYSSAISTLVARAQMGNAASKNSAITASDEKWASLKTTDEGIYRISASDLSKLGISVSDVSKISLYGFGGATLPESPDSLSGELAEVALDVRTDGNGNFTEARFFSTGIAEWRYSHEFNISKIGGLYHIMNPYSSKGNFLLKVGGSANGKRITTAPDVITNTPQKRNSVFTVGLYENELKFEVPFTSREFVGESIGLGKDVTITLPNLAGYVTDTALLRPAIDSRVYSPSSISFQVKANNTYLGISLGSAITNVADGPYLSRNWETAFSIPASIGKPTTATFTLSSDDKQPAAWLNWIEVFYQRKTSLSEGSVPFMMFDDTNAYSLTFTEANNGELWDVSDPHSVRRIATASGSELSVSLQAAGVPLRRFIAYNDASIRNAELTSISTPLLRTGICQTGAQDFIIAPEAFIPQAKKLAAIRERGGQATEPLTVAVISLEDIYREFGYGARDVSAVRDFLAYALRHTAANGKTIPIFATLFGGGHADYQNRTTQLPTLFPIYETYDYNSATSIRKYLPEIVPDDAFFGKLTSAREMMDVAIGRIPVLTSDEADNFVRKVEKYETSSDPGLWRSLATYFTDDRYYVNRDDPDGISHIDDSENEIRSMQKQNDRIVVNKLYSQVYPSITVAGGALRKPELEKAIVSAFNNGTALFSFVGHGNPVVWTNEYVLTVPSTINKLTNFNRLTFLATSTCDFSTFDNYGEPPSGGVLMLTKSDGGAIGLLATTRAVYPGEPLVFKFFETLFDVGCDENQGTNHIGIAYVAGRSIGGAYNANKFLILGDPAQRIIFPRQFVVIDSINGVPFANSTTAPVTLPSLSQVKIAGHISSSCTGADIDESFTGKTTVTLYDAPTTVQQTSTFPTHSAVTDRWVIDGPILYRGTATVTNGHFTTTFIVPKDIKFDSNNAKLHALAYSDDFRSAMGATKNIRVYGTDASRPDDTEGPSLSVFIGNRRFRSGDVVPIHSKVIVDVKDLSGLNTSTASIGHSFIGWSNDSTSSVIDFANSYIANQDDYTSGTSEQQTILPKGKNTLHVRAFDSQNNPALASVEYEARDENPYDLYDVNVSPHPIRTITVFSFLQPSAPDSPVDVTLSIFNIEGRKVREIEQNSISQNDVRVTWDCRDDYGTLVPDAAYAYRLNVRERLSGKEVMRGGVVIVQKQ